MSSYQRVIKYVAMAFAALLAVSIISGIAGVVINVISAVTGNSSFGYNQKRIDYSSDFTGVESLDISNATGNMYLVVGDSFRVEAENVLDSFQAEVYGDGTLFISEQDKKYRWFNIFSFGRNKSNITIYLPEDFLAETAKLEIGAGDLQIDRLNADYLDIDAGVGDIKGEHLTAEKVRIDGGVGDLKLADINFIDANIQCGIGDMELNGILKGDNKLDCGIGDIDLELTGSKEDYNFNLDSGIGTIRVNGEKVSEENQDKNAEHSIKVDGGIGSVNIDFK